MSRRTLVAVTPVAPLPAEDALDRFDLGGSLVTHGLHLERGVGVLQPGARDHADGGEAGEVRRLLGLP